MASLLGDGIGDEVGLLNYDPSTVGQQMKDVDAFLHVINDDVESDVKRTGTQGLLKVWKTEVFAPWQLFLKRFQSVNGTVDHFRDATYDRAERFRQMGIRFRENLLAKVNSGAKVTDAKVPDPIKPPPNNPKDDSAKVSTPGIDLPQKDSGLGWSWLSTLKWAAIIGGGGYVTYKVYQHYSAPAHTQQQIASVQTTE